MKVGKGIVWICAFIVLISSSYAYLDANDVILYYGFDATLNDNSTNGYNGVTGGNPTSNTATKILGVGSYDFDGDDYTGNTTITESDIRTINFWYNADVASVNRVIFDASVSGANFFRIQWVGSGNGRLDATMNHGGLNWQLTDAAAAINTGQWYMVTVTMGTDGAYLYVDGELINSSVDTTTITNGHSAYWGDTVSYAATGFDGKIDEASLWDVQLNSSEIQQLYQSGSGFTPYVQSDDLYICYDSSLANISYYIRNETNGDVMYADISGTADWANATDSGTETVSLMDTTYFGICRSDPTTTYLNVSLGFSELVYYPQRNYRGIDLQITNVIQNNSLFLNTGGQYEYFSVLDNYENPLSGVLTRVWGTVDSTSYNIMTDQTDDAGSVNFYAHPDNTYNYVFSRTGYQTVNVSLKDPSGVYTIYLGSVLQNNITYTEGVSYVYSPKSPIQNTTAYNFSVNITSTYRDMDNCSLYLYNSTNLLNSTNGTRSGTECRLTLRINTHNFSRIMMNFTYELDNETNISQTIPYRVGYEYQGDFSLKTFIDDINSFGDSGFDDFSRSLIGLIVVVVITGWVSRTGNFFKEPESLIVVFLLLVWIVSYVGWFTLDFISNSHTSKYMVFYVLFVAGGAYLVSETIRR